MVTSTLSAYIQISLKCEFKFLSINPDKGTLRLWFFEHGALQGVILVWMQNGRV